MGVKFQSTMKALLMDANNEGLADGRERMMRA